MKIGIEAQRIFRTKKHGMDIYAQEIIQALAKENPSVEFVIFVRKDKKNTLNLHSNVKIVEITALSYFDFEQIWLPLAIQKEKIDLMHYTSNTASLFCSKPYLITVHDIMYLKGKTGGTMYQKLGHYYRKWVVPIVIKRAKALITVSEYEKNNIIESLHLPAQFVHVIYNGVSDLFCFQATDITQNSSNLPEDFLLFLGNEAPKKNMKRVVQAYSIYKQKKKEKALPLVLVETSEVQLSKLLRELQLEILRPDIHLTGYLSQAELAKTYRKATLFLYPSLQESFGIPLIEAMASGTPVITADSTALPEIAAQAAWLIDPTDIEQLADVINRLLTEKDLYQILQKKGLQRAKIFTWQQAAKDTFKLYLSINQ